MHQTSNKGQCYQQPNYSDLAINTALTKELRFKIRPVKVRNYVIRINLLKFQLDPTINEVGTFILRKVCSVKLK